MSETRAFPILLAAALLAALGAVASLADDPGGVAAPEGLGEPLVPDLAGKVNDVARLSLASADGAFSVHRSGDRWLLAEWDDFPADPDDVKAVVVSLAEAERLQARTRLPERHHLLGVEWPPAGDDSEALRVTLADEAGATLADVVLGRSERGPPRSERVNARRVEQAASWLVEGVRRPQADPAQWVERQLVARPAEDMASVQLTTPEGDAIRLERAPPAEPTPDTDAAVPDPAARPWRVAAPPAGRTALSGAPLERVADALASLRMERVVTEPPVGEPDAAWSARFTTHEGLVIDVDVARRGDAHHLDLTVSTLEGSGSAVSTAAQTLDRAVGAWTFAVTPATAERFRRSWDDLLEPLPEPEPEPEPQAEAEPGPEAEPAADDEPEPADDTAATDDDDTDG